MHKIVDVFMSTYRIPILVWLFILQSSIVIFSLPAYATTYFIGGIGSSDRNNGLSPSSAWKTIKRINTSNFRPGDLILFKRGTIWRSQLRIPSSGTKEAPIIFGAYGTGNKPIITGANLVSGWTHEMWSLWKADCRIKPFQVFFNGLRGVRKSTKSNLNAEKEWFWDSKTKVLYIMCNGNPKTVYKMIEASAREHAIDSNGKNNVIIEGLRTEMTNHSVINISHSNRFKIRGCEILQGSPDKGDANASIRFGCGNTNCEVVGNTIGRNTGNPIADNNYASFIAILVRGKNIKIHDNKIYHTAMEETNFTPEPIEDAFFSHGIKVIRITGTTEIYKNTIFHTGGHGIIAHTVGKSGDELRIYKNTISYTGQAGISFYGTANDGGSGYIYDNEISYADRLAGTPSGHGNSSMGIHLNGGKARKGFDKVYIYRNTIHDCRAPNSPNIPDQGGIGLDYYVNGVTVYGNLIYDNWGSGIYMYNANNCEIFYNVICGNNAGITISATQELTANNNKIYNNVCYKNYNGGLNGQDIHCEFQLGPRASHNIVENNILYADDRGYAYKYYLDGCQTNVVDFNVVYQEKGNVCYDSGMLNQNFQQWQRRFPKWDCHSIYKNPLFVDPGKRDFSLLPLSPCIDKGSDVGLHRDFNGLLVPKGCCVDIGAFEFSGKTIPETPSTVRILSSPN